MDPNALWKMLVESLQDITKWPDNKDARTHAIDCLNVLSKWLYMGGFPPTVARKETKEWQGN